MNYGPGSGGWNSQSKAYDSIACIPPRSKCGYTLAEWLYSGGTPDNPLKRHCIHQGYGKASRSWSPIAVPRGSRTTATYFRQIWITDPNLALPSQGGCALLPRDPTACGHGDGSGLTNAQRQGDHRAPAQLLGPLRRLSHHHRRIELPRAACVQMPTDIGRLAAWRRPSGERPRPQSDPTDQGRAVADGDHLCEHHPRCGARWPRPTAAAATYSPAPQSPRPPPTSKSSSG